MCKTIYGIISFLLLSTSSLAVVNPSNDMPTPSDLVTCADGKRWTKCAPGNIPSSPSPTNLNTSVTLTADSAITPTSTELVTFGLPIAEGVVTNVNEIKVSIDGSEVAAYVDSTMTYHWSDDSIRAISIQLQDVDMTAGDITVAIDDTGFSVARLTEQPHSNGWATAPAAKSGVKYPRIFALHDTQYLADSGIIPPFKPAPAAQDAFESFQVGQFDAWAGGLDYSTSTNGNWLFDRSSAMFKAYMTTGRVEFLKEAFSSKQFYFNYVRNDGSPVAPAGGDGCWTYGSTACADGKYIAPQQAKLALALVGDSSQWDNNLIVNMALQADVGWNQYGTRDPFDSENEGFTERGAGMAGLAEIVAYEMTGDATVLAHLNERIDSLRDMQQTVKPWDTANGWTPKSGGFAHNIDVHEGAHSEGSAPTGDTNARGFSPWMSENIADFLWQTYWVTGDSDIPEMLRLLANAIDSYGFTTTYNSTTTNYDLRPEFVGATGGSPRTQGCSTERNDTDMVYFSSAFADSTTMQTGDWYSWYTDNHNIETIFTLAVGLYFETDEAARTRLISRANKLQNGWSNSNCASISSVYRLFNWQHRSNSVRTMDWVREQ